MVQPVFGITDLDLYIYGITKISQIRVYHLPAVLLFFISFVHFAAVSVTQYFAYLYWWSLEQQNSVTVYAQIFVVLIQHIL